MPIAIEIRCPKCKYELDVVATWLNPGTGAVVIAVAPCETCRLIGDVAEAASKPECDAVVNARLDGILGPRRENP